MPCQRSLSHRLAGPCGDRTDRFAKGRLRMLQAIEISKSYGSEVVLEAVSFVANPGERAGLIGANGSGKSTLLRIIAGIEQADSGQVVLSGGSSALLPQGFEADTAQTLGSVVRRGLADHDQAQSALLSIEHKMTKVAGTRLDALIKDYGRAYDEFEALGGYEVDQRIAAVLEGLGLGAVPEDTPLSVLSGGQRTRAGLAGVIASEPSVLLLDEPTNHLDIEALEWLETWLSAYEGAALIVSHDRTFLDGAVTRILELNDQRLGLTAFPGNYSEHHLIKERELEKQTAAWKDQEAETRRLRQDIARTKQAALRTETNTKHDFYRRRAKKVAQKAKARETRLERMLASTDRVERPKAEWTLKLDFGRMLRGGSRVLVLEDVGHEFDGRWLFRHADLVLEHGERIALLGPNGCGKTTLLRIVAENMSPSSGSARIGSNVRIGYMPQDQAGLDWNTSALDTVRGAANLSETEARTMLYLYLFEGDDPLLPVGSLSYGQRARLLLAKLVLEGANLLVMDEPVNHLDIPSRERFEEALEAFPGTVLMAVHDRALIDRYATGIWGMEGGTVGRYVDRRELEGVRSRRLRAGL